MFTESNKKHTTIAYNLLLRSTSAKIAGIKVKDSLKSFLNKLIYYSSKPREYHKGLCYKDVLGITKSQLTELVNETVISVRNNASPNSTTSMFIIKNKIFEFNVNDRSLYIKVQRYLLCFFLKWKVASSNYTISSLIEGDRKTFSLNIYKATAIAKYLPDKYLINTYEKICKEVNFHYNELIGVDPDLPVIIGDGVRIRTCTADNFHDAYKMFDNKHLMHSYNSLGFCTLTGKYCGFWPHSGTNSDGMHSDGNIVDWLVLGDNYDVVPSLFKTNSSLFTNDGTLFLFDRALAYGSYCYNHGVLNIRIPCPEQGILTPSQADETRYGCTAYRWQIEKCFGNLGKVWPIFHSKTSTIHPNYLPIFGDWLNIAGAIANKFGIGFHYFSKQRLKETKWMFNKKINDCCEIKDKSYLHLLSESITIPTEIEKEWIPVKNVNGLIEKSDWTMKKLVDNFQMNLGELRILAGGNFAVRQAQKYLAHSRKYIKVYYSTTPINKDIILVYGLKKRMSRIYKLTTGINKKRLDRCCHGVLLSTRTIPVIKLYQDDSFTNKHCYIDWACTCVIGKRQITADSHTISAIHYLSEYFIKNKQIPVPKYQNKYDELVDIYHFMEKIKKMKDYERSNWFISVCQSKC